MPTCYIIAGPNGAGKTTFALNYLPKVVGCHKFINADSIAAGLSPLNPDAKLIQASKHFLKELEKAIVDQDDFAFETTLSGMSHLKRVKRMRRQGWRVHLFYLALSSPEISAARVAERVSHGGHNIPLQDIIRRYPKSLFNLFQHYGPQVDQTTCYLNEQDEPILVLNMTDGHMLQYNEKLYSYLQSKAQA